MRDTMGVVRPIDYERFFPFWHPQAQPAPAQGPQAQRLALFVDMIELLFNRPASCAAFTQMTQCPAVHYSDKRPPDVAR